MKKELNFEDILKVIATLSMIIDHTGLFFFSENVELRIIGRLAFPIFAFFIGRNVNKARYDVLLAGIILQVFLDEVFNEINILISFFLNSFLVRICKSWYGYIILAIANMISIFSVTRIEYNLFPLMFMTLGYISSLGYIAKKNQAKQIHDEVKYRAFSSIAVLMYFIYTIMKFGFVMRFFDYLLLAVITWLLWSLLFKDVSRDFRKNLFEYRGELLDEGVVGDKVRCLNANLDGFYGFEHCHSDLDCCKTRYRKLVSENKLFGVVVYGLRFISRHTLFIYVLHLFMFIEVAYRIGLGSIS